MIDLTKLPYQDVELLTDGKINGFIGMRDPYKIYKIHKDKRIGKIKPYPAIYFLFKTVKLKSELVYIGKCTSLRDRLQDHIRGRSHLNGYWPTDGSAYRHDRKIPPKDFDTIAKIYVTLKTAEIVEPIYIAHYRPKLNKVGVDQPKEQLDIYHGLDTN